MHRLWVRVDLPRQPPALPSCVLTDAQADGIRRGPAAGMRGPVLIKWVELLLADRAERVAREGEARPWPGPLAGPARLRPPPRGA